jgi:Flp pilus assembly pilin Flp
MVGLICVVLIGVVSTLGQSFKNSYTRVNQAVIDALTADAGSDAGGPVAAP